MAATINQREFSFLLYEFLDTEKLLERPRYAEHSRDIFDSMLETANRIATDFFAPHNAKGDEHEPVFEAGRAKVIPEAAKAWRALGGRRGRSAIARGCAARGHGGILRRECVDRRLPFSDNWRCKHAEGLRDRGVETELPARAW